MRAASECGIPVPRTHSLPRLADAIAARDSLRFPLVAKPASKQVDAAFKVRYYRDVASLEAAYAEREDFGVEYLLQEYVPGEGIGIEVLMVAGEPRLLFAHRRIEEHPRTGGVSILAAAEPAVPELVDASVRLLNHIGWSGVAMVEFRYDRDTRSAVLLEVNGRFWDPWRSQVRAALTSLGRSGA